MKSSAAVALTFCLLGFSQSYANETMEFKGFRVLHSFTSRGSGALMASQGHTLITLHCGNSMKSMQILDKDAGTGKTFVADDFYCQDVANLAANLKPGEKISIRVTAGSLPKVDEPAKTETVVLEAEVKSDEGSVANVFRHREGFGSRWTQLP